MKSWLIALLPLLPLLACGGKKTKIVYREALTSNSVRVVSSPVVSTKVGEAYEYTLQASNNKGSVEWSIVSAPNGMSLAADGKLTWTPESSDLGTHTVAIDAKDSEGVDRHAFILKVGNTCVSGHEVALWLDVDNTKDLSKSSYRGALAAYDEGSSEAEAQLGSKEARVFLTKDSSDQLTLHFLNRHSTGAADALTALVGVQGNSLVESVTTASGSTSVAVTEAGFDRAYDISFQNTQTNSRLSLGKFGDSVFQAMVSIKSRDLSLLNSFNFYSAPKKIYSMLINQDEFSSFFVARREIQICD